jgi:hypothetical protein
MTTTTSPGDLRATSRHVLGLLWVGLPVWCLVQVFGLLFYLFGERPTAAEEAEAARWLVGAIAAAVLIPIAALLLGGRRRWTAALVAGCLFGGFAGAAVADLAPDAPPAPRPYVCQERSGGDSDCPGG